MEWIYLSPHFDDAVFSCGGLMWEQAQNNENCQVWTICAGEIPPGALSSFAAEHHERWMAGGDAVSVRELEDQQACAYLGAEIRRFPVPDCIYRREGDNYWEGIAGMRKFGQSPARHLYESNEAIFGPIHPAEKSLIHKICKHLSKELPYDAEVICPLAIGGHVDHRLTRAAAELLDRRLWYYPDFPYAANSLLPFEKFEHEEWRGSQFTITPAGFDAWVTAASAYRSQISTFWSDLESLRKSIKKYLERSSGLQLFQRCS